MTGYIGSRAKKRRRNFFILLSFVLVLGLIILLFPQINFNSVKKDTPLLWFGKPNKIIPYELNELEGHQGHLKLQFHKDFPSPEEYGKSINTIKAYSGKGDSYQINFTQPKEFQLL